MAMLVLCGAAGCAGDAGDVSTRGSTQAGAEILFDDFEYAGRQQMSESGWIIRTEIGWPGVRGATWPAENVSITNDLQQPGNHLLRMTASTDGDGRNTRQSQVCHQRKYREGTYAARVRFSDAPVHGPDGDQVVETFYAISPLNAPLDPDYSEMDNEYLPNGGWDGPDRSFYVTTWETAQLEPWIADNASDDFQGSQSGWRTLVIQVGDGLVRYYLDGRKLASHGGAYYPEVPMSINFNLWFIQDGLLPSAELREYSQDIDWVFFRAGTVLRPTEVEASVAAFRKAAVGFRDTVRPTMPSLPSPCNF